MLASTSQAVGSLTNRPSVLCVVLSRPRLRPQTTVQALMMPRSEEAQIPCLLDEPAAEQLVALATHEQWQIEQTQLQDYAQIAATELMPLNDLAAEVAIVLVDAEILADADHMRRLRRCYPAALMLLVPQQHAQTQTLDGIDLVLPSNAEDDVVLALLQHAHAHRLRSTRSGELIREVGAGRQRIHQLSEIGAALSSQRNLDQLLQTILYEARRLAGCDAASLYLVETVDAERSLLFKLSQNDSLDLPFQEMRLPCTSESLAGYVAITGHELNLDDVYQLPAGTPYHFNASFDEANGYRTRSMLVLPMRDHRGDVVGVLQFINRLDDNGQPSLVFNAEITELLRAIASQAAVSIQKNQLLQDLNDLFESFVQASVKTIERRDPTTSGHSFRVAQTTVALMQALPRSEFSRFRDLELTDTHLKEVRFAALLHDFGKIGVSERVLTKARKLSDERLSVLHYRIELQKERLRRRAVERQLDLYHGHSQADVASEIRVIRSGLDDQLGLLDQYYDWLQQSNEPDMLANADFDFLKEVRDYEFREVDGTFGGLISDDDLLALSVRQGSLTPLERREIQSHVVHTQEFLATLHWPPEFARVPEIAGAHHEKLDGSGYPHGLVGEQIPLASRVMTVCDIYDALTAMDRPYKPAMSIDQALTVLNKEVEAQLLDPDVVQVFISSRIPQLCR